MMLALGMIMNPVPNTKKKRKIYCNCNIYCSDSTDKLVLSESLEYWNVILRAAKFVITKLYLMYLNKLTALPF